MVDTITPTLRRGINRVSWSMRVKPPRVPRAAQIAGGSTQGPRVVPGTYTVRLTKGAEKVETKIALGLDRRAPFTLADRKAHFDAAMRAHALFGDMSALVDRIDAARSAAEDRAKGLAQGDALAAKLDVVAKKLEEAKKKIVATKEGGAITGEERIREHLDHVYGALNSWEGRPGKYQVERIDALKRELAEVQKTVDEIALRDVRPLDDELKARKLAPIPTEPPAADGKVSAAEARCIETRGGACEARVRAAAEKD